MTGKKPSILYVAPEIPVPHAGSFLGGSTHILEVSKALIKRGFTVYILCRRVSRDQPVFEALNEDLYVYRIYRGLLFPVQSGVSRKSANDKPSLKGMLLKLFERIYFATIYRLVLSAAAAHILVKHRVDAVLERNSAKGIGVFPAKLLGRPVVEEVIDPDYSRLAVRVADKVFAYTPKILQGSIPGDRIILTSAGVDTGVFHPVSGSIVREKYGLSGKKVVVYVGEMSAWHGIDVLVKAAAYLGDDYRILILGRGAEEIKPLVKESGVPDRFIFTGFIEHDHVPQYISAADVAVAPYDPDGLKDMKRFGFYFSPIKLFEYMACSRPVVATDIDIVRDVVKESQCGILARPGDPVELAVAIRSIAEATEKAVLMGEAGRRSCIEKYSWDSVGGGIGDTIMSLIKND